ncbi:hypothetical protein [Rhodohalobacter halophilus]|uniref:hypothetical protein n=1 Tax=Rhodohalobacter halophilus TaxID=1812810 RepID=UPI00083F7F05|nr:hypothetical protein [Rhodohalobacter halophilus]
MNYTVFFAILNLILLSRLGFTLRDKPLSKPLDFIRLTAIPLLVLPFLTITAGWIVLTVYLLLRPGITRLMELNPAKLNRNRVAALLIDFVAIALLASPLFSLHAAFWVDGVQQTMVELFYPGDLAEGVSWQTPFALLFGFLMILNEINLVVRYILEKLKLAPLSEMGQQDIDEKQFRTGRVIGFLERIFVFLFILLGQYTAIGFALAAKGVVRYPEFGNRNFAEYILIGTLLSVLLAMGAAFMVKLFL